VREIGERVLADGTVRTPLQEESVKEALADFREAGVEAIAILFIHSYAFPEHERQAGALARTAGFSEVSLSHEVAREIKAVGRGDTATTNAYLNPLLRRYVENVRQELGAAVPLRFMQSNGGLTDADRFIGKNAVLSGPAGGVVAYAHVCKQAGFHHAIGFDMVGTTALSSAYSKNASRASASRPPCSTSKPSLPEEARFFASTGNASSLAPRVPVHGPGLPATDWEAPLRSPMRILCWDAFSLPISPAASALPETRRLT
jgi:5-oxoprolinase (ATP-hydrolysing)